MDPEEGDIFDFPPPGDVVWHNGLEEGDILDLPPPPGDVVWHPGLPSRAVSRVAPRVPNESKVFHASRLTRACSRRARATGSRQHSRAAPDPLPVIPEGNPVLVPLCRESAADLPDQSAEAHAS